MDNLLDFIIDFLELLRILLGFFGLLFFVAGYRFAPYLYLAISLIFGYTIGHFIGIIIDSQVLAFVLGVSLGSTLAFFNFAYYKHLRTISITLMALVVFMYSSISLVNNILTNLSNAVIAIIISIILAIAAGVISHKLEIIATIIITSWLGAILILHNIIGFIFNIGFSWIAFLISFILAIGGFFLQSWLYIRAMDAQKDAQKRQLHRN